MAHSGSGVKTPPKRTPNLAPTPSPRGTTGTQSSQGGGGVPATREDLEQVRDFFERELARFDDPLRHRIIRSADIETLSASKITVGDLKAEVTLTTGLFKTGDSPDSRVEIDGSGIRFYNDDNFLSMDLNVDTGAPVIQVKGAAGSGSIVISDDATSDPLIAFWPNDVLAGDYAPAKITIEESGDEKLRLRSLDFLGDSHAEIALYLGDGTATADGRVDIDALGDLAQPIRFRTGPASGSLSTRVSIMPDGDGFLFGSAGDTNLYRSAANTLRTDDDLSINGFILDEIYSGQGLIMGGENAFIKVGAGAILQEFADTATGFDRMWAGFNARWDAANDEFDFENIGANDGSGFLWNNGSDPIQVIFHASTGTSARTMSHATFTAGEAIRLASTGIEILGSRRLTIGTNPATTGAIRLPNNENIYFRNAANSANLRGLGLDGSNNVLLGDSAANSLLAGQNLNMSTNFIQLQEIADPAAPGGNIGRLYTRDNGAGKTQLVCRFATGAVQVIVTEP